MMKKLSVLMDFLKGSGLGLERRTLRRLIKICGFPGVDYPVEDIEIDGVQHAVEYLHENPGKFIFLDNPRGSRKRFGQKKLGPDTLQTPSRHLPDTLQTPSRHPPDMFQTTS